MSVPKNKSFYQRDEAGRLRINHAGVIYPSNDVPKGFNPKTGEPYDKAPTWGVSMAEAAALLECTKSAARVMLKRKKITYWLVNSHPGPPSYYWSRKAVERIARAKEPIAPARQDTKLIVMKEAVQLSRLGRSTVQRAMARNELASCIVRVNSPKGMRKRCYIERASLDAWLHRRAEAIRAKLAELAIP